MGEKKRKTKNQQDEAINKLRNLIKECVWMRSKVDRELYGDAVETVIDGRTIKTRRFIVHGEVKRELLGLKNELKKDEMEMRQALDDMIGRRIKAQSESNTHITTRERRFNIRISGNNSANQNRIYRDVVKDKNITTKSSVWPVGWAKRK